MSRDRSSSATHDKLDEPKKRNIEWKQEATEYHTHYTLFIKLIDNTKDPWKQPKAWILEPNCLDSNSSFVTHWHVILGKTLNLCVCFLICEMEMTKTCKVLATVDMLKGRNTGRRGRVSSLLSLRWTVGACVLKLHVHMYVSTYQYFFKHKGMGSIHGLGISPGAGMATHSDILDWKFHGQRSLVGYIPCGCGVGHDWAGMHIVDGQCWFSFRCTAKCSVIPVLFQVLFPYRLLQNIEQSSLCYSLGPCWLSILYQYSTFKQVWTVQGSVYSGSRIRLQVKDGSSLSDHIPGSQPVTPWFHPVSEHAGDRSFFTLLGVLSQQFPNHNLHTV